MKKINKNICVVTSSRSDYGLLKKLIKEIDKNFNLQLIVTGAHLLGKYGFTYKEIENDNLKITNKIYMDLDEDNPKTILKAISGEISELSTVFQSIKPDLLVVLGDRYEILASVFCASLFKIPIAHLCGGDITEGSYDNYFRHAITKMSHIHFVTNEKSKNIVVQMGENPNYVFNYGNPGLEDLENFVPIDKIKLENTLNIKFNKKNFIILYHPTTLENNELHNVNTIITALKFFDDGSNNFYIIGSNSDNDNNILTSKFKNFCSNNKNKYFFESLNRKSFLSLLHYSNLLIGNSSCGIYEAPLLSIPVVNIGTRQFGRVRPSCVIDCISENQNVIEKISFALCLDMKNINQVYKIQPTCEKIIKEFMKIDNFSDLLQKKFFNVT